jgi:integrase/recombinase XerC
MGRELCVALDRVASELHGRGKLSVESEPRVLGLFDRFGRFVVRGFGIVSLREVTSAQVEAFVRASTRTGRVPSIATMRLRRSALRLLFRTARELGLLDGDPTLDLVLPSRTRKAARPLTDQEVDGCRRVCLHDLTSTRLSVAWAFGEGTARTAEIPRITLADVDLPNGQVWIRGSAKTEPRWGALTEWGVVQVARHIRSLARNVSSDTTVAYAGSGNVESRRSFSCQAIRETLERAGLTEEPSVRPASLTGWAGVQVMRETGRIEAVALALGVRSLDAAARMIRWDWTTNQPAERDG